MTTTRTSTFALIAVFAFSVQANAQSSLLGTKASTGSLTTQTTMTMNTPNRMQIRMQADGELIIIGSYFDDFVQITRGDGKLFIRAEQRVDGEAFRDEYREVFVEDVTRIRFSGYEGDDIFLANVLIVTVADGGMHNDTLLCGGSIHGGPGNDLLLASGYRGTNGELFGSYVDGQGGDDEIWGSSLPDVLDGGSGMNTIHGDDEDTIRNASRPFWREYGPADGTIGELSLD